MAKPIISKESILFASLHIAKKRGVQAISIREVAEEAGIAIGSIYNYFPTKTDLIVATMEIIGQEIFHASGECMRMERFDACVDWLFQGMLRGMEAYPDFFEPGSFLLEGEKEGSFAMEPYFAHMKFGLLQVLKKDTAVKIGLFSKGFSMEEWVDFVFSNILALLLEKKESCDFLLGVIRRTMY